MTPVDGDRSRLGAPGTGPADQGVPRSEAGLHFDAALRRDHPGHGGGHGDDEAREGRGKRLRPWSLEPTPGTPASLLGLFQASIDQALPARLDDHEVMGALTRHLVDGVRVGRSLSGDRWQLAVRLQDDVLPATALEIAGVDDQLVVTLRTSDTHSHVLLTHALPRLDQALAGHGYRGVQVSLFLVGAETLP